MGITMLIHNKDDIEFVTEFPCFLGHPVSIFCLNDFLETNMKKYAIQFFPTHRDNLIHTIFL